LENIGRKQDRMTATPLESGQDNSAWRQILDKRFDGVALSQGMIH
jgi:hypothetical protein